MRAAPEMGRASSTGRITVLQFNCGSLEANVHEIRSRLAQQRPDLVLIQETNLDAEKVVKFEGYSVVRVDRSTPVQKDKKIRGGGVMILITTAFTNLGFERLPSINTPTDNTTETCRIRLSWGKEGDSTASVDILNIYIPPIHSKDGDDREQNFSATETFLPAYNDYQSNNSLGLLVAGDVNAHDREWDAFTNEDAIGVDIMNFMDDYGFVVANDTLPTYHSYNRRGSSQHNQRSCEGMEGETAPDVTFLHSEQSLSISTWQHQHPIGKCHHDVLSYTIDLRDCVFPISPQPRHPKKERATSISWSKCDWDQFNRTANERYDHYLATHTIPDSEELQVFYFERALQHALSEAAKELPKGSRPDPIYWCTNKLEELQEARNEAWATAISTKNESDWKHLQEIAREYADELRKEKTKAWEDFTETLNYSTDPTKVMKVTKAINREPIGSPPNATMKSSTGKPVTTNSGKAELFRNFFAKVSRRPPPPKGREARAKRRQLKGKVKDYVNRDDLTPASYPYSFDELTVAISYLERRRACGDDQIHNEFIINAYDVLRHRFLRLINLVWKTGVFPQSFLNSLICPVFKGGDRSPEEPKSHRPVALTSCLCKLGERMVINRLVYWIESQGMFQHVQSAYRIARSTLDPLMRLVADVNNGFNEYPFHRTLAAQLDLTSAFNKVEHLCLLDIMDDLGIPSCFGKFYKGFLNNRRFRVKFHGAISRSAKESCGSPQGTVSSPWLFLIYMEAMLRKIVPIANRQNINIGMFADDLTAWTTGRELPPLQERLTSLIRVLSRWNKEYNMKLSDKKGKCKSILFTNYYRDPAPVVLMNGEPLLAVKQTTLLGVVLDSHLTMKNHYEKMMAEGRRRMRQLSCVANCCFGPSQHSLRNMYVAYVRSVFDYAAPAWYPLMSKTNLDSLQRLQNKALRIVLGVPRSTRIEDLHLEANITPLEARYRAATAYQAEKYRRHPPNDPLYTLAHATPPTRLKRQTWQHYSDDILYEVGIDPSRNLSSISSNTPPAADSSTTIDESTSAAEESTPMHFIMGEDHHFSPLPDEYEPLISLHHRQPLNFTSRVPPWTTQSPNVKIVSDIPDITKAPPSCKRELAESAIEQLGHFDLTLWTDGSVNSEGHGGSACISFRPSPIANPYKKRRLTYSYPVCITNPAGLICCSANAEYIALESALQYILDHSDTLNQQRILIASDAQCILKALDVGPIRPYHYLGVDTSPLWELIYWIMDFCPELVIHYVPGHVGVTGNELADAIAKQAANNFSLDRQNEVCASLSNLKTYLRDNLLDHWYAERDIEMDPGLRRSLLGHSCSQLKLRAASPRPFQTLFSRYRCDRVESAGEYPRRLNYINTPQCRFCGHPRETIPHLLDDCVATRAYCTQHNLSTDTLVHESPSSLLKIARFDAWVRRSLPFNTQPPGYRIQSTLNCLERKRNRNRDDEPMDSDDVKRPTKRNCLVIPDSTLPVNSNRPTKIRRIV